MIKRRTFITGLGALIAAPAIVPISSLMHLSRARAWLPKGGQLHAEIIDETGNFIASPPARADIVRNTAALNPPVGRRLFPTLLDPYGARRPPWLVAGVDYPVGIDRSLYPTDASLKDPRVQANLPAGATISGNIVTITQDKVTLDGYDFSLGALGCGISVGDGYSVFVSGTVVSNCKFIIKSNSSPASCIQIRQNGSPYTAWSSNVTVRNCEFDGSGDLGIENSLNDFVHWAGTGSIICLYCYFYNAKWHCINFRSNNATTTAIVKYCVFSKWGQLPNGHGNPWYFEINDSIGLPQAFVNGRFDFNLIHQPSASTLNGNDSALAIFTSEATNLTISNTTANNNVILNEYAGGQGMGAVFSGAGYLGSITNVDMSNNYYDPTHATTVWAVWSSGGPGTGYGTTFTATGNINMVTGNPAPAHPTP